MIEIKKQERETTQSLIRRFSRRLKGSGVLMRARSIQYRVRPKSAQAKKKAVLRKIEKREMYEKLEKLGKAPERRGRRR